jgi:hypothetical protein
VDIENYVTSQVIGQRYNPKLKEYVIIYCLVRAICTSSDNVGCVWSNGKIIWGNQINSTKNQLQCNFSNLNLTYSHLELNKKAVMRRQHLIVWAMALLVK